MTTVTLPSQEDIKQLLAYDPETGKLFWKFRPVSLFKDGPVHQKAEHKAIRWNKKYAGKEAGGLCETGYLTCSLLGKTRAIHRVVWKFVHGNDPEIIDHINGIPSDNRISNLRSVNCRQNARNMKKNKRNTSGHTGVSFYPRSRKWVATIKKSRKYAYLGSFDTIEEAVATRKSAEIKCGYHANHGR